MGRFVNPDNAAFQVALNSKIYVDKTKLLEYTNSVLDTVDAYICNSRPRRFGKSYTANMLSAYYSRGCDSEKMFAELEISKISGYKEHLNKYDVIHMDIQWFLSNCEEKERVVQFITNSVLGELRDIYSPVLTEEVVKALANQYDQDYDEVKRWYDGYTLGKEHLYNPKAVVSIMLNGEYRSYWSATGSYEVIVPLINMDFDGLKTAIIEMLSGAFVKINTSMFQNDTVNFKCRDDVLTYLIHLGYLAYDWRTESAFVPNEEIRKDIWNAVIISNWSKEELDKKSKKHTCVIEKLEL